MARFDTRRWPPPVRVGLTMARQSQAGMQTNVLQTARGADQFGARQGRYASVPIALRMNRRAGPNAAAAVEAAKPFQFTRRKRGYPVREVGSPAVSS